MGDSAVGAGRAETGRLDVALTLSPSPTRATQAAGHPCMAWRLASGVWLLTASGMHAACQ